MGSRLSLDKLPGLEGYTPVLMGLATGIIVESYSGPWSNAACVWSCGTDTVTCPLHIPESVAGLLFEAVWNM